MQGYIIDIKKVRDDDLLVSIITQNRLYTTYRFYGARHSLINIGFKIDFELELSLKSSLPRLKEVLGLGFEWILDTKKLYLWQRFLKLFYPHLKDIEKIDDFYMLELDMLAHKMIKQDTKRAIIETYLNLLFFEGRLNSSALTCFLCEKSIENNFSLVRSFLPTHSYCSYSRDFEGSKIKDLFNARKVISFDDEECGYLWDILMQGF